LDGIEAKVWNSHAQKRSRKRKEEKPMEHILEEILEEEVSEEVWQQRLDKRQKYVLRMKQKVACIEVFFHDEIPGPDPLDRGISKRSWEALCKQWRNRLAECYAKHGIKWQHYQVRGTSPDR
jgi:CHAT domain-containing protein